MSSRIIFRNEKIAGTKDKWVNAMVEATSYKSIFSRFSLREKENNELEG